MDLPQTVDSIKSEVDNYIRTVQAIKAVANELLFDDVNRKLVSEGKAYFGRRLDTSPNNRISPNNQVTPDLVVSLPLKQNVVVEAKLAMSGDTNLRKGKLIETQKYDDNLTGFDTNVTKVTDHDLILLVSFSHAKEIAEHIVDLQKSQEIEFKKNFAIIRFIRSSERKTWFVLDLVSGGLTDQGKTKKFERSVSIDMERLISNPHFGSIEFYDADPPLPLLMDKIHELILNNLTREQSLLLQENSQVEVAVTVSRIRDQLADSFGPGTASGDRTPDIPKSNCVDKAFQAFVKIGWAKKVKVNSYTYDVRKRRKHFEQFYKFCAQELCKTAEERERQRLREIEKHPLFKPLIEHEKN
jgi:hypothetical protein